MTGFAINGAHLVGAVLGFWAIARLARSRLSDRVFWIVALAACALMAGALLSVSDPPRAFEDFVAAYLGAGRAVLEGPDALRPLFEKGVEGFVNLPLVAVLFTPFGLLGDKAAIAAFFAVGGAAVLAAWALVRRHYGFDRMEGALSLFAVACYGPLIYSFREGNTSHILLLALAGGLVLSRARRDLLAGAAFAAAAIIKPPLLLIGVYYALRGRFRVAAGGLALCAAAFAASVALFGWDLHVLWLREFSAYSGLPMPGFNAQSIASAVIRIELGRSSYFDWSPHTLSVFGKAVTWGLTLAVLAAGVWACTLAPRRLPRFEIAEEAELWLVVAFLCVASTVSWSHYYVWLLPAFAFFLAETRKNSAAANLRPFVIAAFILTAPAEFMSGLLGAFGPLSGLLVSHLLIGGLLLYGLLVRFRLGPPDLASSRRPR